MNNIKVSVIIPTYKRSYMLGRAIESVLNQTLDEIEVVVVDDNDPNTVFRSETEKFMEQYLSNPKIKYIRHEKNKNGAAARNTGIKFAKGIYIALLDDDDFFYPEKLRKQVEFLDKHIEYDAVYCGRVQKGRKIYGILEGDLSKEILTQTFTPTTPALMFRKAALEKIGGFDESFRRHQDYELLLKFFRDYKMGSIREPLVEIGQNAGENELHGEKLEENKIRFLKIFENDINRIDNEDSGFRDRVYISHYRSVFCDHLSMKFWKKACDIYVKGCKISFVKFNLNIIKYLIYYIRVKVIKILNSKKLI